MRAAGGFPPCDVVNRMVICYKAPPLAYQHLHDTSDLLPYIMPELEPRSVLESAVQVYLLLSRFAKDHIMDRLLEIAGDGDVDQDTQAEFNRIVADLRELARPCLELDLFWRGGQK